MEQLSTSTYQWPSDSCWSPRFTIKAMPNRFFLIGDDSDTSWNSTVAEALSDLGLLDIYSAADVEQLTYADVEMIIIDAGAVPELSELIVKLRQRLSTTVPIVVASASPTWQTAKEVLLVGANDCIRKTLDPDKLRSIFEETLNRSRQ